MAKPNTKARPVIQTPTPTQPRLVLQTEAPVRRLMTQDLASSLIVGRADEDDPQQPDVDLNPAGAKQAGVSRLHARFSLQENTLYVEDLGSTNGTRINGFDLIPGKSYRLTTGDELELGSLRMTARFVRPN